MTEHRKHRLLKRWYVKMSLMSRMQLRPEDQEVLRSVRVPTTTTTYRYFRFCELGKMTSETLRETDDTSCMWSATEMYVHVANSLDRDYVGFKG